MRRNSYPNKSVITLSAIANADERLAEKCLHHRRPQRQIDAADEAEALSLDEA